MISNIDQRVLFWDSSESAFTDITKAVNNFKEGFAELTFAANDYLYIGTFLPFNHRYFNIGAPNSTESTATVEMWNGSTWSSAADILDYTILNDASFGKSNILQFTPNQDYSWALVGDTTESSNMPEFASGPTIIQKYWMRIGFNVPVEFQLKYVGNLFCNESDLFDEYPALDSQSILSSWDEGKTSWPDQRVVASEYVVTDLKRRNIIIERSQILDISIFKEPAVNKAANIIYNGLGVRNYQEEVNASGSRYTDSMNLNKFETDINGNGQKDRFEQVVSTSWATR